ncbi:hypothetical protein RMATCC62417_03461 [Rhizopus microsporus]|nr:hypothetical protein RMATCC62417_03461 [Rhizopus microsporus]
MNCEYCHVASRKFYCVDCIKEKLTEHKQEKELATNEKNHVVQQATLFLNRASVIQALLAKKNKLCMSLQTIQTQQVQLTKEIHSKTIRISDLKRTIEAKRRALDLAEARYKNSIARLKEKNNMDMIRSWQRLHKMTVGTRRILVKEVASLFELKPGVIEETVAPTTPIEDDRAPFSKRPMSLLNKEDLYICGVTLPTKLIDVSKYPKEELNAPINLVTHMLRLIVHYLGIKLPFMIFQKGIHSYIRIATPNAKLWHNNNKMPLFLDDEDRNFRRFVIGMAMLNYDIAYLCYTQGIEISLSQVANTLQGLMACCYSSKLGMRSHAIVYKGIRDLEFPLEFQQVLRMTALRYRSQHAIDRSSDQLDDLLLYLDSDEEMENDDKEKMDKTESSPAIEQSEHWNLVDVMPSFRFT